MYIFRSTVCQIYVFIDNMFKFIFCTVLILGILIDFGEGTTIECYKNEKPCSTETCYDPSKQVCLNGGKYICNIGEELCGKNCFSNETQTCLPSLHEIGKNLICNEGEKLCGPIYAEGCYSPSTHTCHENGRKLCNGPKSELCKGVCFDTETQICLKSSFAYESRRYICNKGEKICGQRGYEKCYSPSTQTCNRGGILCDGAQSELCGNECYSTLTHTCLSNRGADKLFLCNKGEKLCGRKDMEECYSPTTHTCNNDGEYLCEGPRSKMCGRDCFNPDAGTHRCDADTLCTVEERGCHGTCYGKTESTAPSDNEERHCYDVRWNSDSESFESTLVW